MLCIVGTSEIFWNNFVVGKKNSYFVY